MVIMPMVMAAEPISLFPSPKELLKGLTTIFKNESYTPDTVETILRFALLIISVAVIHRILEYTLGEHGKAAEGLFKKEVILVISIVSGIVTALLIPLTILINGITVILLAFITYFGANALHTVFKEKKGDEEEWKVIAILVTSITVIYLFANLILVKLGGMSIRQLQLPKETFDLVVTYAKYTLYGLIGLLIINIISYLHKRHEPKTAKDKTKEALEPEEERTRMTRTGLAKRAQQKIREAIGNTVGLMTILEQISDNYDAPKPETNLLPKIKSYLQWYKKFENTEDELQDIEKATAAVTGKAKKIDDLIAAGSTLLKDVKTTNTTLTVALREILTDQTKIPPQKPIIEANIQKLNKLLNALLKVNQEEKKETATP